MLTTVVLPLALAIIMLSLGMGLTFADFTRVATRPLAFLVGLVCQMLLLPLVAFVILQAVDLPATLEVGLMILSFCPGGITSNMLTKLARGDVALSVTLTGVISVLFIVTLPILVPWAVSSFQGAELASQIDVLALVIPIFVLTVVPVAIGVLMRTFIADFTIAAERWVSLAATILFVLVVVAAVVTNLDLLLSQIAVLGPVTIALNAAMLLIGFAAARLVGLGVAQGTTVGVEVGVQNATLGLQVAAMLWLMLGDGTTPQFSEYALPSALYGVLMYFVVAPFIWWRRSLAKAA